MERLLSYDRLIAHHRNRLDVPLFPNDKLNMAYKDNKFNQFLIQLNSTEDVELIKKCLKEIYNQLQSGDEVYKYSVKNPELLDRIFDYLLYFKVKLRENNHDSNGTYVINENAVIVRTLSSQCFKQFCLVLKVKNELHQGNYLKFIYKTFDDDSEDVKLNVYQGLIYFAQSRYGIDTLLENEILQTIIKKITEEKSLKVINLILTLSNEILSAENAPQVALKCKGIPNLKMYLNSHDQAVKENVILNYGSISLCEEGKFNCVEEGSLITNILEFLKDKNSGLKILIASTRFLMSASILKRGKVEIFENDGLESCIEILNTYTLNASREDDDIIQLILNVLQIIGNVSEEPRGRKKMFGNYLGSVEKFLEDENRFIKEQANITRNIIIWKP
jgi:hypothetical protein